PRLRHRWRLYVVLAPEGDEDEEIPGRDAGAASGDGRGIGAATETCERKTRQARGYGPASGSLYRLLLSQADDDRDIRIFAATDRQCRPRPAGPVRHGDLAGHAAIGLPRALRGVRQ